MKILFLTQYFPPEIGAPQNRLFELAIRLKDKGAIIKVLTAMPNYPEMKIHKTYKRKFYWKEEIGGLDVIRTYIYVKKSNSLFIRLLNYFSFVCSSCLIGLFKLGHYDFIFCESPPLFLGITAYLLKLRTGAKLIFNVSDLWPESAAKLGLVSNRFLLRLARSLEEFMYINSWLITGQTQGIVKNISTRFPTKKVYWLKNGVDINFFDCIKKDKKWRNRNNLKDKDMIFLYAGIIGYAQGLEVILNVAKRLEMYDDLKFILMGSGPEKEKLVNKDKSLKLKNVMFLDVVSKDQMPGIIGAIDAAIIPLKKIDLFKGAIPSKIFEYLAMKKPLVLGVDGEAKDLFIEKGKCSSIQYLSG